MNTSSLSSMSYLFKGDPIQKALFISTELNPYAADG